MVSRGRNALLGIAVLFLLAGCVGEPEPAPTPKTPGRGVRAISKMPVRDVLRDRQPRTRRSPN